MSSGRGLDSALACSPERLCFELHRRCCHSVCPTQLTKASDSFRSSQDQIAKALRERMKHAGKGRTIDIFQAEIAMKAGISIRMSMDVGGRLRTSLDGSPGRIRSH